MDAQLTNCVALGVSDVESAAKWYEDTFGWSRTDQSDHWVELSSGPMRMYICDEDGMTPTFEVLVDDPVSAAEDFVSNGCMIVGQAKGETFVKDPFGRFFCVTKRGT